MDIYDSTNIIKQVLLGFNKQKRAEVLAVGQKQRGLDQCLDGSRDDPGDKQKPDVCVFTPHHFQSC